MRHPKETININKGKWYWRIICFIIEHNIKTTDISKTMWKDMEHHICKRCNKEWEEVGYLHYD